MSGELNKGLTARRLEKLVARVCPTEVVEAASAAAVVEGFRRTAGTVPVEVRSLLRIGAVAMAWGVPLPSAIVKTVRDVMVTVAYEQPPVHAALGYHPADWVARTAKARSERWADEIREHESRLLRADPLRGSGGGQTIGHRRGGFLSSSDLTDPTIECDAVVVGSGAGGSVVAAELAESGWSVVVLEEGPYVPTEQFSTDALTSFGRLYRDGGASVMLGKPMVGYTEGRCVGGSTTVNGGMSWRTPPAVIRRWRQEHALSELDGELDEAFARVERRLSVGLQDEGSIGRDQELLRAGARSLGWDVVDNRRAQVHCGGCNACLLGCPTGAKQSTLVSYLPRAVAFGATVIADCRVDRVLFHGKRAVGARGTTPQGRAIEVRAAVVVVAGGAVQTPALLLRSGFSSPSGQLGRNLSIHPGANVVACFDEQVEGWKGVHQAYQVREFADRGVLMAAVNLPPGLVARALPLDGHALASTMADYDRIVTAGVLVDDTSTGTVRSVRGRAVPSYRLSDHDRDRIVEGIANLCTLLLAAGANRVYLPFADSPPVASPHDVADLRSRTVPTAKMAVSTVHLMGTARMGGDPTRAVCDAGGRVHDTAGLYVADASLLPTPLGVNPMETIMALATVVAQRLLDDSSRTS